MRIVPLRFETRGIRKSFKNWHSPELRQALGRHPALLLPILCSSNPCYFFKAPHTTSAWGGGGAITVIQHRQFAARRRPHSGAAAKHQTLRSETRSKGRCQRSAGKQATADRALTTRSPLLDHDLNNSPAQGAALNTSLGRICRKLYLAARLWLFSIGCRTARRLKSTLDPCTKFQA